MYNHYLRKDEFPIGEILPKIGRGFPNLELRGEIVSTSTLRLLTFKNKGCQCVACGIKASYFALETHKVVNQETTNGWHLNLYAVTRKGEEIQMTQDHIIPKSLGGPNTLENLQPMCQKCNSAKGNKSEKRKR